MKATSSFLTTLLLSALATGGCAEESTTVRLIIDTDLAVPDELDELRISMAATRGSSDEICTPEMGSLPLSDAGFFPYIVDLQAGETYNGVAVFRVEAFVQGRTIYLYDGFRGFRDGVQTVQRILIVDDCECGEGFQCEEGECVEIVREFGDWTREVGENPCFVD